jgi:hypothetical protein
MLSKLEFLLLVSVLLGFVFESSSGENKIYECTFDEAGYCGGKLLGSGGLLTVSNRENVIGLTGYVITDVSSIGIDILFLVAFCLCAK